MKVIVLILVILRKLWIGFKCLFIFYKSIDAAFRFQKTFKTWRQHEIYIFLMNAILIMSLAGFEFIRHNIDMLFILFLFNSFIISF